MNLSNIQIEASIQQLNANVVQCRNDVANIESMHVAIEQHARYEIVGVEVICVISGKVQLMFRIGYGRVKKAFEQRGRK